MEEKLRTVTDYVPKPNAPVDQLIEIARRFKIPMGIEWVEGAGPARRDESPVPGRRSISELIEAIAPGYRIETDNELVHIYLPSAALHPFNFLNLRLKHYQVKDADLFDAQDALRWAIRFTLEPEKYLNGANGGYGDGSPEVFEFPRFTLSGSDLTIREILNRMALAQGNALWVATINLADLRGYEPRWKVTGADGEAVPLTSAWHFFPLAEIAELAKEQVVVEVTIPGMVDERMTTIPVLLEHGLAGDSGGMIGGGSSDGTSFEYGASLEKLGKDFVTISVHLKVSRQGESGVKFDERFEIHRDHVKEFRPDPRIKIRAYFELAERLR